MFVTCQNVSVCPGANRCRFVQEPICLISGNMCQFVLGTIYVSLTKRGDMAKTSSLKS